MEALWRHIVEQVTQSLIEHEAELTRLDQAVGDGDFGFNLKRGMEAIQSKLDSWRDLPFNKMLQQMGMTLVSTIGGSSGPILGSFLMAMGKAAPEEMPQDREIWVRLLEEGIAAIKKRGKAEVGQKTLLDVLVPVVEALKAGVPLPELRQVADEALEKTKEMEAVRGRAAALGERAKGHLDPGARAIHLATHAILKVLEGG